MARNMALFLEGDAAARREGVQAKLRRLAGAAAVLAVVVLVVVVLAFVAVVVAVVVVAVVVVVVVAACTYQLALLVFLESY